MKKNICIVFLIMCIVPALSVAGDSANEIIGRSWDYMRGTTSVSIVHMTVHRKDWERKSTLKAWTKGREDSIFQIIAPKKDKGNGTLKLDRDMRSEERRVGKECRL